MVETGGEVLEGVVVKVWRRRRWWKQFEGEAAW